jgi:putative oxidoreductase
MHGGRGAMTPDGLRPRLMFPVLAPLSRLAPVTEALIRLVAGLSLVAHGTPKVFGGMPEAAAFLEEAGFSPGYPLAVLVAATEFAGGLALAFGLLTRAAAFAAMIFLIVAISYHWQFGFYWNEVGYEYPLFWSIVCLHFVVRGGGPYSIDRVLGREP